MRGEWLESFPCKNGSFQGCPFPNEHVAEQKKLNITRAWVNTQRMRLSKHVVCNPHTSVRIRGRLCFVHSHLRNLALPPTMGRIHVLSESVANKIAAGEVEALCGRERSGSPQLKSRAQRGISSRHG